MSHAWQDRAACLGEGHWFFAPEYETPQAREIRVANAKTVCAGCPVIVECGEAGADEQHGIWGGLTEDERGADPNRKRRKAAA